MILNYKKFLEKNTYHSITDLLNLAREIQDFTYNNDVTSTDYFKSIIETKDGYIVDFSFNGDKKYTIKKDNVLNKDGVEISIDGAYYNLDMLFNMIKTYLNSYNIQQIDESKGFNKEKFIEFYKELCKSEKIEPLPIKFGPVAKLGGVLIYNSITKNPLYIKFDVNKVPDIEFALYHEMAHQICLIKYKYPGHDSKFKKEFNRLNDKYMYGDLSMKYMKMVYEAVENSNDDFSKMTQEELKRKKSKLLTKAFKMFSNSPAQLKVRKEIDEIGKYIKVNEAMEFEALKNELMSLVEKSAKMQNLKTDEFIKNWVDENSIPPKKTEKTVTLEGLIQDEDILDFYLKFRENVDSVLKKNGFFNNNPNTNGLYEYVIDGTKQAIFLCLSEK